MLGDSNTYVLRCGESKEQTLYGVEQQELLSADGHPDVLLAAQSSRERVSF